MKKFIMKMLLSKHPKVIWCLRNLVPMVLFPVANFYLFEWYLNNPWKEMKVPIQFLNIYLFELLMALFLCVFGRLKWSLRLQSIFLWSWVWQIIMLSASALRRSCRGISTLWALP